MRRGTALVIAGYALAAVPALRLRAIVAERDRRAVVQFGALELGHLLIATGWTLKGRRVRALVNAGAFAAFAAIWVARAPRALPAT